MPVMTETELLRIKAETRKVTLREAALVLDEMAADLAENKDPGPFTKTMVVSGYKMAARLIRGLENDD